MSHIDLQTLIGVSTILTFVSPYLAAVFTQQHYARWANELIAVTVSIIFGVLSWLCAGGSFDNLHNIGSLLTVVSAVSVGAKVYYEKLAKAAPLLPAIEWWTGGKQAGFPKPIEAFAASTSVTGDSLPDRATDSNSPITESGDVDLSSISEVAEVNGEEPSVSATPSFITATATPNLEAK